MKKVFGKVCICCHFLCILVLLLPRVVTGQTIVIYFVAPSATMTANFPTATNAVNCPGGYLKIQVGASNVGAFRAIAPPQLLYIYNQLQTGTALRKNLNLVYQNSGGAVTQVEYFLVDDRTALVPGAPTDIYATYTDIKDSKLYIWPAANNQQTPAGSGRYIGWVMFGEHQLQTDQTGRIGGIKAVDEVVLHETSHTQLVGDWSKWGSIGGNPITYGKDGSHYFSRAELLGDQEGAMDEGMATFYGLVMNDDALRDLMDSYATTDNRYFVEAQSVLAGMPELYSVKGRQSEVLADKNGNPLKYGGGGDINIYSYRWLDVPGFYLMFAESTSTAFYSIFRNQTYQNKDTAFNMCRSASRAMSPDKRKRFLTYACNRIALRMEGYNNGAGRSDASRVSSIFPFALLDLLTHFGMTDEEYQADYRRNNADRNPKAYTEYFSRRTAIKALVQADLAASPIKFNDALKRILTYCKDPANMF